jgi:hypothetical protein
MAGIHLSDVFRRTQPRSAPGLCVFGVTTGPQGEGEQRIYSQDLRPLDALRLLDGLTPMTPADQAEALRFALARNPRFSKVRLCEEEWEAGGEKRLGRKLLVDVSR